MREQIATYLFKTVCNHGELLISSAGMKRVLRKSTQISTEYWLFWKYSSKYWVHIL